MHVCKDLAAALELSRQEYEQTKRYDCHDSCPRHCVDDGCSKLNSEAEQLKSVLVLSMKNKPKRQPSTSDKDALPDGIAPPTQLPPLAAAKSSRYIQSCRAHHHHHHPYPLSLGCSGGSQNQKLEEQREKLRENKRREREALLDKYLKEKQVLCFSSTLLAGHDSRADCSKERHEG